MWFMFVSSCFYVSYRAFGGTPGGSAIKNLPVNEKDAILSLGWEDSLEKEMATHSCILALEIPRTEEPAGYSPWSQKESQTGLSH